jgi:hypothetical protein
MKTFSFTRTILALLTVCALCYAPVSSQTLDSAKVDTVQKARENWYWFDMGIGFERLAVIEQEERSSFSISLAHSLSMAFGDNLLSITSHFALNDLKHTL